MDRNILLVRERRHGVLISYKLEYLEILRDNLKLNVICCNKLGNAPIEFEILAVYFIIIILLCGSL